MNATLVVLSKYPEIFEGFRESVDRDAPEIPKIVVWDKDTDSAFVSLGEHWASDRVKTPFQIAVNANRGWRLADGDVLYAGDDVRLIEPNTIQRLHDEAYSDPQIGIVGANVTPPGPKQPFVPFVFVFIKRVVIDAIGYLDERFTGYGCEDVDLCYRAAKAGFKIGMANGVTVQHGVDGATMMSTFRRVKSMAQIAAEDSANCDRLADKLGWQDDLIAIWQKLQAA